MVNRTISLVAILLQLSPLVVATNSSYVIYEEDGYEVVDKDNGEDEATDVTASRAIPDKSHGLEAAVAAMAKLVIEGGALEDSEHEVIVPGMSKSDTYSEQRPVLDGGGKQKIESKAKGKRQHIVQNPKTNAPAVKVSSIEKSSVTYLNRVTFHANVLAKANDHVDHWIVRFCYDWYEPCKDLTPTYHRMADWIEGEFAVGTAAQTKIRFVDVDCGVDKPMCNEQGVDDFPRVVHYHKQEQQAKWTGGGKLNAERLEKWLHERADVISKGTASDDKSETLDGAPVSFGHAVASGVGLAALFAAHVWLVSMKEQKSSMDPKTALSADEKAKQAPANGPSGLGAMLPEDWVAITSSVPLFEL